MDNLNAIEQKKARGSRLRNLRGILNLSRDEMSELLNISVHTLKSWELGKLNGLTEIGASKVVDTLLNKKQMLCDFEWLMFGSGNFPNIFTSIKKDADNFDEKSIFMSLSKKNSIYKVKEDMWPPFLIKDMLLGLEEVALDYERHHSMIVLIVGDFQTYVGTLISATESSYILVKNDTVLEMEKKKGNKYFLIKRIYIN